MRRNRTKIEVPYVDWMSRDWRNPSKYPRVHEGVYKYASDLFASDLAQLYYGDLYVIPLSPDGEEYRLYLYNECWIGSYGAYETNFKFNGVLYLAILVNND